MCEVQLTNAVCVQMCEQIVDNVNKITNSLYVTELKVKLTVLEF